MEEKYYSLRFVTDQGKKYSLRITEADDTATPLQVLQAMDALRTDEKVVTSQGALKENDAAFIVGVTKVEFNV